MTCPQTSKVKFRPGLHAWQVFFSVRVIAPSSEFCRSSVCGIFLSITLLKGHGTWGHLCLCSEPQQPWLQKPCLKAAKKVSPSFRVVADVARSLFCCLCSRLIRVAARKPLGNVHQSHPDASSSGFVLFLLTSWERQVEEKKISGYGCAVCAG